MTEAVAQRRTPYSLVTNHDIAGIAFANFTVPS